MNTIKPIEKKCPECGGEMYYEADGLYEGEFCVNGDFADIDVVSNCPLSDREAESLLF